MEKNLGHATAYGYAKSKGYSGTEDEFARLMADYASVGQSAAESAEQAAASATSASGSAATASQAAQTATSKASEAVTAAGTATTKASEASTSADTASTAAQTATDKASEATTAASTATTKASEAAVSANTATTAKTDAETARDAAAQSASEAAESARTLTIDATLTQSGQAADAKKTGDEITDLKEDLNVTYEKAKKYRVYVEGTITDDYIKQTNLSDYARSYGMYLTALVTGGDTYYVSGTCVDTSFPLVIMVDSNESVIGSVYTSNNNKVDDKEITFPDNCVKVYINGRVNGIGTNYPSIYKYAYSNDIMADIVDNVQKKQSISYRWDKAESTETENAFVYMSSGNLAIRTGTSANGYKYAMLDDYNSAQIYRFYGTCKAESIPIVICCDADDKIIKTYGNTVGDVYKGQILTDIPQITKRIYVNGILQLNGIEIASERKLQSLVAQKIGVAFGDSIVQGNNVYVAYNITPYQDFPSVASGLLGCKIYNGGLGGGTYSAGRSIDFVNVANCIVTGDYTSIIDGIDQYSLNQSAKVQYADIADLDFNEVDFITLSYGTNDWNFGRTISEITTAMISGISALLTEYPHLKIYVFTPIFRFNVGGSGQDSDTYVNATSGLTLPQVCEAIKTCANNLCLPCKDMYHESNINPYTKVLYMGDDTHPNANGYALMGEKVSRFINSH